MLRKFLQSAYTKAALTLLISGGLLLIVDRWLKGTDFTNVFAKVNSTMTPIYIGILLAFLLCPIYNYLVQRTFFYLYKDGRKLGDGAGTQFFNTKVPKEQPKRSAGYRALKNARIVATLVCFAIVVGIVSLIAYFVLPQVISSIVDLVNTLPARLTRFAAWATEKFAKYPLLVKAVERIASSDTTEIINWIQAHILNNDIRGVASTLSNSLYAMFKWFMDMFVGLLISIYLLNYKEHLFAIGRKIVASSFSEKKSQSIYEFGEIINETFIGFFVGRIIDAVIIGFLTYFSMTLLDLPMAILISVIVGFTNVIPFFGPFLGAIPSVALLMLEDPIKAFYFLILILVIQQVDGNLIGPKVVGTAIGISSFWILIAVLIGGGLFGFVGMALGVPVFAVIYRYIDKGTSNRLNRKNRATRTKDYLDYSTYGIEKKDLK